MHLSFAVLVECNMKQMRSESEESESKESEEYVVETNTGFYSTAVECAI